MPTLTDEPREDRRTRNARLAHLRHELRTPLNAVIGYSEMLLEEVDCFEHPAALPSLSDLRAHGYALLGQVNDLLDPNRIAHEPGVPLEFAGETRAEVEASLDRILASTDVLIRLVQPPDEHHFTLELVKIREAALRFRTLLDEVEETLRMEGGASSDGAEALRPASSPRPHGMELGGRILVVDDHQVNRELLESRLSRDGYEVTLAEDGEGALRAIRETPPDLVLLDVMMPELDGYQVLQRLKEDEALRHIPVVMLSALDELDSVVRCIEAGAEDYLSKPFNQVLLRARISACLEKKRFHDREVLYLQQIEAEKRRADELLHVLFPPEIVAELKATNAVRPRLYENVAVLFCDLVGFTPYCEARPPEEVIAYLQQLVERYEDLTLAHNLQKIKTVGDSFMAVAGLLRQVENPPLCSVRCALEMLRLPAHLPSDWKVRIGIHVGPAIAGVLGHRQYLFDLWGDTVNTAARVQSYGQEGCVNVSESAWQHLRRHCEGESLGLIHVKGKGPMELFRISGLKPGS